ncbi:winged helix-turn-helix domain-containing protein [Marilutibacter spongiae]|uniref:Winged helix-turn-helix domain-containing protein n=1 Tax=Marilutibacter spongiae TaxID=2025720 RepID=A0A7W3TMV4_9GAMM|nr:winged helix-turn-helix domain-containing protein [Lysobacter spongiae]MBB1061086.1 winged helix-turn-helix domain-containing protein [Lysobacter spongiae]
MTSRFKPAWPGNGHRYITIGEVRMDLCYRTLSIAGEDVGLPQRAFDLLWLLAAEPHALHYRADLLDRLWPGLVVEDANLSQSAWLLRKALGPERKGWLRTVVRAGYVFEPTDPVCVVAVDSPMAPAPAAAGEAAANAMPGDVPVAGEAGVAATVTPTQARRGGRGSGNALLRWLSIGGGCLVSLITLLAIAQEAATGTGAPEEADERPRVTEARRRQAPQWESVFATSTRIDGRGGCGPESLMRATSPCGELAWGR